MTYLPRYQWTQTKLTQSRQNQHNTSLSLKLTISHLKLIKQIDALKDTENMLWDTRTLYDWTKQFQKISKEFRTARGFNPPLSSN